MGVPCRHQGPSAPLQPHRIWPILAMGQCGGRIQPLIQAITKLSGLEWPSLKGPLEETSVIGQGFKVSLC